MFCGECGDIYRRIHWNNRGKKSVVWRCVGRLENKDSDCGSPTILEEELQGAVLLAINQVISDSGSFAEVLEHNIATMPGVAFDRGTAEVDSQLLELQEQIVKAANRKEDYNSLVDEMFRLKEERQSVQEYNANHQGKRQRIAEMTTFLEDQTAKWWSTMINWYAGWWNESRCLAKS